MDQTLLKFSHIAEIDKVKSLNDIKISNNFDSFCAKY